MKTPLSIVVVLLIIITSVLPYKLYSDNSQQIEISIEKNSDSLVIVSFNASEGTMEILLKGTRRQNNEWLEISIEFINKDNHRTLFFRGYGYGSWSGPLEGGIYSLENLNDDFFSDIVIHIPHEMESAEYHAESEEDIPTPIDCTDYLYTKHNGEFFKNIPPDSINFAYQGTITLNITEYGLVLIDSFLEQGIHDIGF